MNKKIEEAVNKQIQAEMFSAYLYLAMAGYCERIDLPGAAGWFRLQAQEEVQHAMKFFTYLNDVNGELELYEIAKPPKDFGSLLDIFEAALEHEKEVTSLINALYKLASEENDYSFQIFLQWFINEQVEEESTVMQIIAKIKMIEGSKEGLFLIDQELGKRSAAGGETSAE